MASEWLKEGRVKLNLTVQGIEYSNRTASASFIGSPKVFGSLPSDVQ